MKSIARRLILWQAPLALSLLILSPCPASAENCGLPRANPEVLGFSTQRLGRLDDAMRAAVDQKTLPGAVIVLARHGKVVDCKVFGYQNLERGKQLRLDSIFRIASMTKPVTGVAMMILYEEGKWQPDDPIEEYIPELSKLKVFAGTDNGGALKLEEAKHPPTIAELMTHTAGFTYGLFGDTPVDKLYKEADPLMGSATLKEFAERLGRLPLLYQPGEQWAYSVSVDIQGLLVERLSGKSLPDFVRERIFEPLGMKDTDFYVLEQKLSRLVTLYSTDASGVLKATTPTQAMSPGKPEPDVTRPPTLAAGGHGLFSTAADYLRFCQMLLNGGQLDGVRVLSPSSVRLMRTNHLPDNVLAKMYQSGDDLPAGEGFGYDVAVDFDPSRVGNTVGKDTFHWRGMWGTWFWVDPTNDLIFVGMIQKRGSSHSFSDLTRALTYQALLRP